MVHKIKEIKDQVLRMMEQSIGERGLERIDVKELGELSDIVKDLAEAEKACWEAEYYMNVSEAMGSQGYMPDMGYDRGGMGENNRRGYRDSRGRYARRPGYTPMGYGDGIREELKSMTPEERDRFLRELH